MAFDVAAIQDKYGVNEEWATGNDTYVLKDVNEAGTFYSCIWDAGGSADSITYSGARNANIDLRPATLEYEFGGGGADLLRLRHLRRLHHRQRRHHRDARLGVGQRHADRQRAVNVLTSGAGNDVLDGGGGADRMVGGTGDDSYKVDNVGDQVIEALGGGRDTVTATIGYQLRANVDNLTYVGTSVASLVGNELNNFIDASSTSARVVVNAFGTATTPCAAAVAPTPCWRSPATTC